MASNPEFKLFNDLQITITGFCVNTPADLLELLQLLDERDKEVRRLAKVFNLEHLLEGKVTWNLEVDKTMTKDEAIQAMLKGEKVTHTTFTAEEWVTMTSPRDLLTEEGYTHNTALFWQHRNHPNFSKGWSIWKETFYCHTKDCKEEIPEPVMCCSGRDCGCLGQPIDPPYCPEHYEELKQKNK